MDQDGKDEQGILFPEIEVEGLILRPWSFGQLANMGPVLQKVMAEAKNCGFTPKDFDEGEEIDLEKFANLLLTVAPLVPEIVAKTTMLSRSEIDNWDPDKGVKVFLAILTQNMDKIKNSFGLSLRRKVMGG
ncbi:MAG: hypothetical protein M0R06_01530 [Sphaerochaeta sp.]|jgi:hypothetical protein|nr:hypothetical protein [Sphaerochaeta sp.]